MAEFEWSRPAQPAAEQIAPQWLGRLASRLTDWEDWLTLVLALGATMSVSLGLEQSGWSENMPPITLVAALAIVASLFVARSGLSVLAAWPLAVLAGVLVVFWQTLELVGSGNLEQRLDAIYFRFETWFNLAVHNGVSNDSLPFNVLVLSLTWLGVFLFGWSVFRWQNAWIGLIPGGITLFLDMALVGDDLAGSVLLYMLFGFLSGNAHKPDGPHPDLAPRGDAVSSTHEPDIFELHDLDPDHPDRLRLDFAHRPLRHPAPGGSDGPGRGKDRR